MAVDCRSPTSVQSDVVMGKMRAGKSENRGSNRKSQGWARCRLAGHITACHQTKTLGQCVNSSVK
jgi:hypothetical protein